MFGLCFHKYTDISSKYVTYIDEGWNFVTRRCDKCGKVKIKKEIVWRR